MAVFLRRLVSQQKRRFQQDGFDLDLAYITPRIIAMGLPAEGGEGLYRNPISEITKFLHHYHPNRHRVYNLCAERSYHPDRLHCDVAHYPFEDHQPPPLGMVQDFVSDAFCWLVSHPDNVIAVHCKAGKGRTGTMICCLLLFLALRSPGLVAELQLTNDAVSDVLDWYADKRTLNCKGVTIQSQQRFVKYYYSTLDLPVRTLTFSVAVRIQQIRIRNLPTLYLQSALVTVYHRDRSHQTKTCVSASPRINGHRPLKVPCFSPRDVQPPSPVSVIHSRDLLVCLDGQPHFQGDIKIQLFKGSTSCSVFYTWFNTAFLPPSACSYTLASHDLDRPAKGLPPDVEVQVMYEYDPSAPLTPRQDTTPTHSAPVPSLPPRSQAQLKPPASVSDPAAAAGTGKAPARSGRRPFIPRLNLPPRDSPPSITPKPLSHPASTSPSPSLPSSSILNLRLPSPLVSPRIPDTPPAHDQPAALLTGSSTATTDSDTSDAQPASPLAFLDTTRTATSSVPPAHTPEAPAKKLGLFRALLRKLTPGRRQRSNTGPAAAAAVPAVDVTVAAGAPAEPEIQWQQFQQAWHTRWWMGLD